MPMGLRPSDTGRLLILLGLSHSALLTMFKEQNTLLRALWVTKKPEGGRPKGFWSPEGKPTKPEAKCFAPILTWYPSQTNVIYKKNILEWNQF